MNSLYLKARDACIDNVRQYIQDAKKLIETGSHGHACALLILGREELGKAFIYHEVMTNEYLAHNPEVITNVHTKTPKAHLTKLVQFRFLSALKEAMEKKNYTAISEFYEGMRAYKEENVDKVIQETEGLRKKEKKMNKLKMDALYVDTTRQSVLSPSDSKFKELAPRLLTELESLLDFVVNVIFKH